MDPTDAAALWMQYLQPLKQTGVRLGAPAVTNADTGRTWLEAFFAACTDCEVDFLPLVRLPHAGFTWLLIHMYLS
jgi:hypothetical protein